MPRNTSGLRRGGPGRPKGRSNNATIEVRALCDELVSDPAYRANFKKRLIAGKLAPAVECMVWHYAKGKPADTLRLEGNEVRPLVIDTVRTREQMLAALGGVDVEAGGDK